MDECGESIAQSFQQNLSSKLGWEVIHGDLNLLRHGGGRPARGEVTSLVS